MLNYIWSGLIVSSLVFALWFDVGDLARDTYRNGQALTVELVVPEDYDSGARVVPVEIRIDPGDYRAFYASGGAPSGPYQGELLQTLEGRQLRFDAGAELPEPLATIQAASGGQDGELQATVTDFDPVGAAAASGALPGAGATPVQAALRFEPVRFVKMNAIAQAAYEGVSTKDARIYCVLFPCSYCCKAIIQAGIKHVIYQADYSDDLSRQLFEEAGIELKQIEVDPNLKPR